MANFPQLHGVQAAIPLQDATQPYSLQAGGLLWVPHVQKRKHSHSSIACRPSTKHFTNELTWSSQYPSEVATMFLHFTEGQSYRDNVKPITRNWSTADSIWTRLHNSGSVAGRLWRILNGNDGLSIEFASLQDEIWATEGCNSVVKHLTSVCRILGSSLIVGIKKKRLWVYPSFDLSLNSSFDSF